MWEFVDKVVYINLERRKDRLEHMKNVCKIFPEDKVLRFNAIENSDCGLIGAGKSHSAVLEMAIENKWKNVLVLEDDATWNKFEEGYDKLEKLANIDYDVIMLGGALADNGKYDVETSRIVNVQTTTAYLVHQNFYNILLQNFKEGVKLLEETNQHWNYAIDQYWKILQPQYKFFMIVPNLMYQMNGYSDNTKSWAEYQEAYLL